MKFTKTTVIGVGGTGQSLLPSLLRMLQYHNNGTKEVVAYDGDQFDDHNIERQIHSSGSKADRMNALLQEQMLSPICRDSYMSRIKFERICSNVTDGVHLVIATVDNDATRKMCIDVLMAGNGDFIFVTPGNSDASTPDADIKGNVLWFGRVDGNEVGINPALLFPNIEKPQDGIPRKNSCLEGAVSAPQLIAANALASAYTLTVIQGLLDDKIPYEASHLFFNGRALTLTVN